MRKLLLILFIPTFFAGCTTDVGDEQSIFEKEPIVNQELVASDTEDQLLTIDTLKIDSMYFNGSTENWMVHYSVTSSEVNHLAAISLGYHGDTLPSEIGVVHYEISAGANVIEGEEILAGNTLFLQEGVPIASSGDTIEVKIKWDGMEEVFYLQNQMTDEIIKAEEILIMGMDYLKEIEAVDSYMIEKIQFASPIDSNEKLWIIHYKESGGFGNSCILSINAESGTLYDGLMCDEEETE